MKKTFAVILFCLLAFACSRNSLPTEVTSSIEFGGYKMSPPHGYWYFSKARQLSPTFRKKNDFLAVLTLWPNKESMPHKDRKYAPGEQILFINFCIAENRYDSFKAYYAAAEKAGVTYTTLSPEEQEVQSIPSWSCKQSHTSVYGIECISLRQDLLTMGLYGSDKDQVLANIPVLKSMIESLHQEENNQP